MFDGRQPVVTTEYEYEDGLLVRSFTVSEPVWTEQDRAEALALQLYRDGLCPHCRFPVAETTAHYSEGPEYDATHKTCRACAAFSEAKRAANEGSKDSPDSDARLWQISKI